jgi:surfeit locus 1 family protein
MALSLRFAPGRASTVVLLLLLPSLVALGLWQLDRARQKRELNATYTARLAEPALQLQTLTGADPAIVLWRDTVARGRYRSPNLALDNRVHDGRAGYEIFTPFELADGSTVLVSRGWIAADPERNHIPALDVPGDETDLHGRITPFPWVGISLGSGVAPEQISSSLLRVQRLEPQALGALLRVHLAPFVIALAPDAPNGFARVTPAPTVDVGRHQAYAFQWFAMAVVLVIIYIKINLRPAASHR